MRSAVSGLTMSSKVHINIITPKGISHNDKRLTNRRDIRQIFKR